MALRGLLPLRLGQVVKGVHELGGRIYPVDIDVGGHVEEDVGVVEDDADVGVDHQVGDLLGGGGGGGDDADDLLCLGDALFELVYVLDDDVANGAPDLLRVIVEDVVDYEAPLGQDRARRDGAPEVARADQRDVVGLPQPQDVPYRLDEIIGLVTHPPGAGEPDRVQVPANLHRVYDGEVPKLLARDRVAAFLDELVGRPKILGQPVRQAWLYRSSHFSPLLVVRSVSVRAL